jgi:hypothetical protein
MEIDSVNSVVYATMAMKNENIQTAYQIGLFRAALDQEAQSMSKILETLPQQVEALNLAHLGRNIDIRA